ncbi:hypothetical protein DL766_002156 [Monosporascus sp. MC13-8B]|uniref:tRNA wybutosine-synthesizing protein 2 n=1 Tax=Monosporascus cannonballus TaxID=155416 RepID=A0ABY0HGZ0_9PEZI|nr:hypothetical protein DL763_007934 [Monosporascus cannonballus]RYO93217.1 hypothetical protein DL762_001166 [Monosporascus cannonballus]RYP36107.1 hypothetical protein DL766_002156 [Monosporascus sp. MC13-8B]
MNSQKAQVKPKRKAPQQNPIEAVLVSWFDSAFPGCQQHDRDQLVAQAPKRWIVYEPMVLLPTGAFGSAAWREILRSADRERLDQLWRGILSAISKRQKGEFTHLAVNEGIPLHTPGEAEESNGAASTRHERAAEENILRSPSGLRMLYGDFGPAAVSDPSGGPSAADFEAAFWVSTKQNGIFQTWAPRWTMFSRGNIKEKARLLDFHSDRDRERPQAQAAAAAAANEGAPSTEHGSRMTPEARARARRRLGNAWAVDLYAGIGYFVFSYARLGMRVLCWELNPWSVEGLRRGARANGWGVRVVRGRGLASASSTDELVLGGGGEQIVVFLEDNARAAARIGELRRSGAANVLHVNCGLLPTSEASWRSAWDIVRDSEDAWLHLHENVGVADVERRKGKIERWFGELAKMHGGSKSAYVDHVERVKTFAPGVWHCVFDMYITTSSTIT